MVTGAGGIYGEAIIRSLKACSLDTTILAVDCMSNASGFFIADHADTVPRVKSEHYLDAVSTLARQHQIDLIFVASGAEMPVVTHQRDTLEDMCGALVVLNPPSLLDITEDKWKTCLFLQEHGLAAPRASIATDPEELSQFAERVGFPIIVKPRTGDGSRDLSSCSGLDELVQAMLSGDMVAQEELGDAESEYTVGVLGTEKGEILGSIAFRRLLGMFGRTIYAEVVDNPDITSYAETITRHLKPRGYCNVQLRLHHGQPVAFEINGRVSSSTGFRTAAGFNEAEILIRHYLLGQAIPPFTPKAMRLVRVHQELELPLEN